MKDIVLLLFKKTESIKCICFVLITCGYHFVYRLIYTILNDLAGAPYVCYASRLFMIVLLFCTVGYFRIRFLQFYKKNWESLILLGCSNLTCLLLFFLTKYDVLFLFMYFSAVVFQINQMNWGVTIAVSILNTLLIAMFAALSCVMRFSKKLNYVWIFLSGFLGYFLAAKKISFPVVSSILESNVVTQIIFSDYILAAILKFFLICSIMLLIKIYMKNKGVDLHIEKVCTKRKIQIGDFIHKRNPKLSHMKNYVWLYKDKDFLLWKIFSTVLWISVCCITTRKIPLFFFSYGISLVSSCYFIKIYHFERTLLFDYYMSNYSYFQMNRDLLVSGFCVLGDNIFLVLMISCFFRPDNLVLLSGMILVFSFMTLFINNCFMMRYPMRQRYINLFFILIALQIPILNIWILGKSIRAGKMNWENMNYESKSSINSSECY